MIRLEIFGDELDKVEIEATEYVNKNVKEIIQVLIDMLEDNNGFEAEDFLPYNNFKISNDTWKERVYALYDIVDSRLIRPYIKPKYEYLLYVILVWWEECADEEIIFNMDADLAQKIRKKYEIEGDSELSNGIIHAMVTFEEYFYILFQDHDFLPESLEELVMIYLKSKTLFARFFGDVDLDEYREFMAPDLLELYEESKRKHRLEQQEMSIEQKLYEDIIFCCERVQSDFTLVEANENRVNDKIRDLLNAKIYTAKDQTRQGISAGGKDAGNVDILIELNQQPISLIEALKLDSMKEDYLAKHINKIYGYDTKGFRINFIISYVQVKNFKEFSEKYWEFIKKFAYPFKIIDCLMKEGDQYPEIRTFEVILDRNGIATKLVHILIHIGRIQR